ncbi:glycosyltransferase [Micromonospora sp. NPDC047740]|uniref:glycosyltransferase n=1 Tax=Micromonospora sp. NPDC047740 TaxID=3364254 RepID=UPI003710A259
MIRILMLGMHRFPHGDAPSNRMLAMARSFAEAGCAPYVVGNGVPDQRYRVGTDLYVVDGVPFTTVRDRRDRTLHRALARIFQTLALARAARRGGTKDAALIYVTHSTVTLGLTLLCRLVWRRPLLIDCTEWHEPSQFRWGRLSPQYLRFAYRFRFLCRGHVIGITRAICAELSRRGNQVVRIPPQVDMTHFAPHGPLAATRIELFYGGSARGKDDLGTALRGLMLLTPDERSRFRFTIAGPSRTEISELVGGDEPLQALEQTVNVIGRVSRDEVLRRLAQAHFTVLLRPVSRYSAAGFPSKIPESLAAGTPPLVNLTSDLADHLADGYNAVVVDDCSAEAFAAAARRVLTLDEDQLDRMSRAASDTARSQFDCRAWADASRVLISQITGTQLGPDPRTGATRHMSGTSSQHRAG